MRGTISVGTKSLELLSNAATALLYKRVFHEDLLKALTSFSTDSSDILAAVEVMERLAFIMNKQAEDQVGVVNGSIKESDFLIWLTLFEESDFQDPEVLMGILGVWNKNLKTVSDVKNA